MTDNLTTQQVLEQTGATYRQLDEWTRKGHVTAVRRPSRYGATTGSGVPRRYTPAEAAIVELMVRMVDAGVTPPAAARAARHDGWLSDGVRVVLLDEDASENASEGVSDEMEWAPTPEDRANARELAGAWRRGGSEEAAADA